MKPKTRFVVYNADELVALGDGNYEIVWSTTTITVSGKRVETTSEGFPMEVRRMDL